MVFFLLRDAVKAMGNSREEDAIQFMQNTIRSIPRHKMDHPGASVEERNSYHAYCRSDFCEYVGLTQEQKLAYHTDKTGEFWYNELDKDGKPISEARNQIIQAFDDLSTLAIMRRCTMWVNQNNNESIHHRLFRIISKTKSFKYQHILFASLCAAVIHNVGYEGCIGHMYQRMGTYYVEEQKILRWRDDQRRKNSGEKHRKKKTASRYQLATPLVDSGQANYEAGFGFEDAPEDLPIDGVIEFEERQAARARDAEDCELDEDLDIDHLENNPADVNEELDIDDHL